MGDADSALTYGFDAAGLLAIILTLLVPVMGTRVAPRTSLPADAGGLIGTFALYHVPLAAATVAVFTYRALALWLPAVLGSVAFVRLRRTLARDSKPAAMCGELAAPLPVARSAARA
ncbi:MAG: hypothetical protein ACXVFO_08010 [Solirubrobacteraceae bacterium]